ASAVVSPANGPNASLDRSFRRPRTKGFLHVSVVSLGNRTGDLVCVDHALDCHDQPARAHRSRLRMAIRELLDVQRARSLEEIQRRANIGVLATERVIGPWGVAWKGLEICPRSGRAV